MMHFGHHLMNPAIKKTKLKDKKFKNNMQKVYYFKNLSRIKKNKGNERIT